VSIRDRTRALLFASLGLASAANATEKPGSAPVVPAWAQVETTPGHLAFVRSLTAFALDAPPTTLPDALAAARSLPADRSERAETVLAHAFVTRDTEAAVRWHAALAPTPSLALHKGFFIALVGIDPARAWRDAEALVDPRAREFALGFVASAHARTTPLDALAQAERLPEPLRSDVLPRALDAWIQQSPDAAFSWMAQNLPDDRRRPALRTVLPWLSGRDFAALLRLEASTTDPLLRDTATETIDRFIPFQPIDTVWQRLLSQRGKAIELASGNSILGLTLYDVLEYAATRPSGEVAAAFARIAPEFDRFPHGADAILSVWVLHAPDDALAWAKSRSTPERRDAALLAAQPILLEVRPDLAFAQLDAAAPGPFREELVSVTARSLSQSDASRALNWTLALPSIPDRGIALDGLFQIAIYDTELLALATPRLASDPDSRSRAVGFADLWIQCDPTAASAWFATLPPGPLREEVQNALLSHSSRHAPEAAIARALELPNGPERALLIEKLIDHQTAAHPAEIFALVDTLPDGSGRRTARDAAIAALGARDPLAAATLLDSGALGDTSPSSIRALAIAWADHSPAAAAEWLTHQVAPSGNHADILFGGVSTVARRYGESAPDHALAWARSLPDPRAVRVATIEAAKAMAPRYPDRAWREALATYPDERALHPVLEAISRRSPDRARRLLDEATLPAEVRAKLAASLSTP
jgi:hypothetical protein